MVDELVGVDHVVVDQCGNLTGAIIALVLVRGAVEADRLGGTEGGGETLFDAAVGKRVIRQIDGILADRVGEIAQ